jgi:hypothetical protein
VLFSFEVVVKPIILFEMGVKRFVLFPMCVKHDVFFGLGVKRVVLFEMGATILSCLRLEHVTSAKKESSEKNIWT